MTFDEEYFNLGRLDILSYKNTLIHRLDARIKVIAAFAFIVTVVSFPKYALTGLIPFFLFPVLAFSLGDIPVWLILKKVLCMSPFAVFIGIFNPFFDQHVMCSILGISVTGGFVSFFSILLKFFLTICTALLLIATTSFPGICHALSTLGVPKVFIAQLLFLYRYIFVLMEEAMRMVRARDMRSFGAKGQGMKVFAGLIGTLLLRTVERAERIYHAMLSRGFTGTIQHTGTCTLRVSDIIFLSAAMVIFYFLRFSDIVGAIGRQTERIF